MIKIGAFKKNIDSNENTYESVIIFKSDGIVFNKTYNLNESWEFLIIVNSIIKGAI